MGNWTHAKLPMDSRFSEIARFGPAPVSAPRTPRCTLGLFVACYNEADNIRGTLETVAEACRTVGISYEIVIIDDASQDGSVAAIKEFARENPAVPLTLYCNRRNQGLGANYAEAAFLCDSEWYRLVCGDNVEPLETLVTLFREVGTQEILVPYFIEIRGRAWHRKIISRTYTALVNLLGGFRLRYYNGLIVTRRDYVMRWHSNSHGFGFQADLLTRLLSMGIPFREIGLHGQERQNGRSKAFTLRNMASVAHSLQGILLRRLSRVFYGHC